MIDLVILSPRHLNCVRNSIIHFRMFLYLVTCFLRVTVSLLYRFQSISKIHVPIYSYLIIEGRPIGRPFGLPSYWRKTKTMRKCKVEFLRKSDCRGDKIAQANLNSHHQTYHIYFQFVRCWGPLCCKHFKTSGPRTVHL